MNSIGLRNTVHGGFLKLFNRVFVLFWKRLKFIVLCQFRKVWYNKCCWRQTFILVAFGASCALICTPCHLCWHRNEGRIWTWYIFEVQRSIISIILSRIRAYLCLLTRLYRRVCVLFNILIFTAPQNPSLRSLSWRFNLNLTRLSLFLQLILFHFWLQRIC